MSMVIPTAAERSSLEFTIPGFPFVVRYILSLAIIVVGTMIYFGTQYRYEALFLVLLGHVLLWVKKQRLAPGGATPDHEEVWAPVEAEWYARVRRLEQAGTKWDTSPWDVSNTLGCLTAAVALFFVTVLAGALLSGGAGLGLGHAAPYTVALLGPLWLNGRRNDWHPSELRLKGQALEAVRKRVAEEPWEAVPLLALRDSARGQYPVDARMMLRPKESKSEDFIGIQVQVSMNTVRGRRYPYLYAVVLAKEGFRFPKLPRAPGLVLERETNEGVTYVVVRQYADNSGGWHTDEGAIAKILDVALELAGRCLR